MTDAEKLKAVIHENNRLRKENERLRGVEEALSCAKAEATRYSAAVGHAWRHANHWKGRDDARGKAMPALLAAEWNAAIEAAAGAAEAEDEYGVAISIRALKREVPS